MQQPAEKQKFMTNLRYLNSILFLFLSLHAVAQSEMQVLDKVVAVVGENVVLMSDIEQQIDQMSLSEVPVTANSRCEVLESMMYQKLFVTRAKLDSVTVTEDQVNQELNRRLRYFISQLGSEEELEKFYGKTTDQIKEDFRDEVEEILLVQQMQQTIVGDVKVSPAEVREFFASIPMDSLPYINAQMRIAQISIQPPASKAEQDKLIAQLKEFKARVEKGENFGALAYLYSQDPGSAENNGELGFVDRTDLVAEFANAAIGLQPGEVSEIVKTEYGYHLIQMIERKGDRMNVRHILLIPQVSPMDLQKGKLLLDSIRTQLNTVDTITFRKMAAKYSNDKETRMNGGELVNPADGTNMFDTEILGQVDRTLLFTVQKLKVGEISSPELYQTPDGKRAYRIVKLEELTAPHIANLKDDYNRLQETAKRKKENLLLESWINKHCTSAYVWIDPSFQTCAMQTKWVIAQR